MPKPGFCFFFLLFDHHLSFYLSLNYLSIWVVAPYLFIFTDLTSPPFFLSVAHTRHCNGPVFFGSVWGVGVGGGGGGGGVLVLFNLFVAFFFGLVFGFVWLGVSQGARIGEVGW